MIYTLTLNPSLDYIITIDQVVLGKLNEMKDYLILAGGKGINVSLVLNNLGIDTIATGFNAGFVGKEIVHQLDEMHCKHDFVTLDEGCNRINIKLKSEQETEINAFGPNINENHIQELIKKLSIATKDDYIVLSGSVPKNLSENIYQRIMQELKSTGAKVVLDTRKKYLECGLEMKPFLVKPNKDELEEMFGVSIETKEDIEKYAKKLQQAGAENVLVSLGKDGAMLLDSNGKVHYQNAPKGKLINSVGAGDSMVAGFLAGYIQSDGNYEEALITGVAAGSASAFSRLLATKEEIIQIKQNI